MKRQTLIDVIARAAGSERGIYFVGDGDQSTFVGYREIESRARRVGRWFKGEGVRAGDVVAIVLPTGLEFFCAFFGALFVGATPTPMYPPIRLGRLDDYHARSSAMLRRVRASLLVTDRRIRRLLGRTIEGYSPTLGVVDIASVLNSSRSADGGAVRSVEPEIEAERSLDGDDRALIQFSSGTTALPKAIALSHRQILANVDAISAGILEEYPEDHGFEHRGCSWLPLYHDMGLVGAVFVIDRLRDLVLLSPEQFMAKPASWLRAISRYRATISSAPNFAYSFCVDRIRDEDLTDVDLSSWCVAMNGAEPVTPRVLRAFSERFKAWGLSSTSLTPVYGLGEAALAVTFSPLRSAWSATSFDRQALARTGRALPVDDDGVELVSLGRSLRGFAVDIRDETRTPLAPGELGDIWIKGPSLMIGYVGQDRLTRDSFDDEWLNTGDRGFMYEGRLYLFERAKETVIIRGRNYAAQDIEGQLQGVVGIRPGGLAAVGSVGEEGEVLWILAETKLFKAADRDDLAQRIRRAMLGGLGLNCQVRLLDPGTLPRTSSGKVARVKARRRLESAELLPPRRLTASLMLGELYRSVRGYRRARRRKP